MKTNIIKTTGLVLSVLILISGALVLTGCEDTLMPFIEEEVRLAELTDYKLTILDPDEGSVTPSGIMTVKSGEPLEITAILDDGSQVLTYWDQISGSGTAIFEDDTALITTVALTNGDAVIQPQITNTPRILTINTSTGGYVNPSGAKTIGDGIPYQLHAYAYGTYLFDSWSGSGTANFSSLNDKDATVTVTGGNATITASFKKANITFTEVGVYQFQNSSSYPNSGSEMWRYGNYLYFLGLYNTSSSVIREINISDVYNPSSGSNDYHYVTGKPKALIADSTYLYAGTDVNIYKFAISGFYNGSTAVTPSTATPVQDLSLDLKASSNLWGILGNGTIGDIAKSNLANYGYVIINPTNTFKYITGKYGGLLAIEEDDSFNDLNTYKVDVVTGATFTAADDSHSLNDDWGWAGRPVLGVDREYAYVPVAADDTNEIVIFEVTDNASLSYEAKLEISGFPLSLAVDEYYIYVGGYTGDVNNSDAQVYVIDMRSKSAPVLRKSFPVPGTEDFEKVNQIYVNGNYLYILADTDADKPKLIIYEMSYY